MQIFMFLFFLGSEMLAPGNALAPAEWLARRGHALNVPAQTALVANPDAALSARLLALSWLAANDAPAADRAARGLADGDDPVLLATARALSGKDADVPDEVRWRQALRALPSGALLHARLDYARIAGEEPFARRLLAQAGTAGGEDGHAAALTAEIERFYGILHAFRVRRIALAVLGDEQGQGHGLIAAIDGTVSAAALRRIAAESGLTNIIERRQGDFSVLRFRDGIAVAVGKGLSAVVLGRSAEIVDAAFDRWQRGLAAPDETAMAADFSGIAARSPAFLVVRVAPELARSLATGIAAIDEAPGAISVEFSGLLRGQGTARIPVVSGFEERRAGEIRDMLGRQVRTVEGMPRAAKIMRFLDGIRVGTVPGGLTVDLTAEFDLVSFLLGFRG